MLSSYSLGRAARAIICTWVQLSGEPLQLGVFRISKALYAVATRLLTGLREMLTPVAGYGTQCNGYVRSSCRTLV